jgi:hypothetical protein
MVYVLNGKASGKEKQGTPDKKDLKKAKKEKSKDKTGKTGEKDKLKVKSDSFGADLDASSVRSSRNVSVVFHVRPACIWTLLSHVGFCQACLCDKRSCNWQRPITHMRPITHSCCPGGSPRTAPASGAL